MNKCMVRVRVRVRDAHKDDVKDTTIKKKKKIKYMSIVYGDFHQPKSNLDLCTNLVCVLVIGWVMLDPL